MAMAISRVPTNKELKGTVHVHVVVDLISFGHGVEMNIFDYGIGE